MLVVVGVDLRVHLRAIGARVFIWVHGVSVEDARELDFRLDGAILVEDPLAGVLVVGRSEDLLHDELARPSDDDGIVTEVAVLEEDAVVLFVDANGVLDVANRPIPRREIGIEVVDSTLAVAAETKAVGHVASAVFTEIEGVLALVRMFRVATKLCVSNYPELEREAS